MGIGESETNLNWNWDFGKTGHGLDAWIVRVYFRKK